MRELAGFPLSWIGTRFHMSIQTDEFAHGSEAWVDYRLYFIDANNHIRRRVDLECRDDAHAIEVVGEHAPEGGVELWQGARLVKRFDRRKT